MGGSASSQLDESKCNYIRGKTEAVLKNFSPHYKRQLTVAFFNHIQTEVEQNRDAHSQFLKHKSSEETGKVLYEAEQSHFAEELRKWKDRYIVIKNDYMVDCHESKEAYQKGVAPKRRLQPTGGKAVSSEDEYNTLVDKSFPDPTSSSEKENAQPLVSMPTQFPVYFWHPAKKHGYFYFQDSDAQKHFNAVLYDCIRHSNYDFLKQMAFEVQAFLEAVQFYRQEKGQYGSWDMLVGEETQILSNLVMEELLPSLQTELLPKMKGKKNDRKRTWFATVEEAYNLVLEQVTQGFSSLQEECKDLTKELEGTIRSDMDQIIASRNFVAGKLKATVSDPAERCLQENIQPYLASILEELMGPMSSGFSEIRMLFENEVNELSKSFQSTNDVDKLKENVSQLSNLPSNSVKMQPCYLKVDVLREQLQELRNRFKFSNTNFLVQSTQNYMQGLLEDTVYTFEHLLSQALKGDQAKVATAIEKVKQRVLKQYDYDSSTIRKKLFQEALVQITLPTMQKTLASSCKPELQNFEQYIFADYTRVIQVENVYEDLLRQTVLSEVMKVVKEAASLKKHNLFEDIVDFPCASEISLTDSKSPPGSMPASPAKEPPSPKQSSENNTQSKEEGVASQDVSSNQASCPTETVELTQQPVGREGAFTERQAAPDNSMLQETIISDTSGQQESVPVINLKKLEPENEMTYKGKGGCLTAETNEVDREQGNGTQSAEAVTPGGVKEILDLLTVTIELPVVLQQQQDDGSRIEGSFKEVQGLTSDLNIQEEDQSRTDISSKEGQELSAVLTIHEEEDSRTDGCSKERQGLLPVLAIHEEVEIRTDESLKEAQELPSVLTIHEEEKNRIDGSSGEVQGLPPVLKTCDEESRINSSSIGAHELDAEGNQKEATTKAMTSKDSDPQGQYQEMNELSEEHKEVELATKLVTQLCLDNSVLECATSPSSQEVVSHEVKADPSFSQGEMNVSSGDPETPSDIDDSQSGRGEEEFPATFSGVNLEANSKADDSLDNKSEQKPSLNGESTGLVENANNMVQGESCI